jgi:outer membrane protein TolC
VNAATTRFIEQFGLLLEADGYPRVAGRLFGLLLVTEDMCSLDELAEQLDVSKASVSINARLLEDKGVIERVTLPGDRRDYYRVAEDMFTRTMEQRVARIRRVHDVIVSAKDSLPVKSATVQARLERLETAHQHLLDVTMRALEEWRQSAKSALGIVATLVGLAPTIVGAQAPTQALTLGDAARLAARQSAIAVGAHYRAEEIGARAREAGSALLPNLSASWADGKRTFNTASFGLPLPGFDPNGQVIGPVRTVDVRGRVVAPLFNPAAFGRYRSAQAAASGAEADAASSAEQAASIAAAAYVRVLRAEAQVSARAADSALARELLGIAQSQLQAGVGVALDVTRARAQVAGVRAQLIAARAERARARLDLLRTLGLPLTTSVVLTDSLGGLPADVGTSEATAIGEARRTRPDLRAALAAVATARRALSAARAERLPTVGVFGDDGATSNSYTHLLNTYTYGIQVSLPIFEGFRTAARVQEQQAVLRQAETRERDLEAQVEADVRGAILDLASAREQVEASRERLGLAEQELQQARERFRAGVAGNADVITAQLGLDAARSLFVDVLTAAQAARVSLARAQGRVTALP